MREVSKRSTGGGKAFQMGSALLWHGMHTRAALQEQNVSPDLLTRLCTAPIQAQQNHLPSLQDSQTPASFLAQVQADGGGGGQKPSKTPALLPAVYPPQSGVQLWDFSPTAPGGISCCPCPRTARGSSPGGSRKRSCVQIGSETLNAQPRPRPLLAHACVSTYACICMHISRSPLSRPFSWCCFGLL